NCEPVPRYGSRLASTRVQNDRRSHDDRQDHHDIPPGMNSPFFRRWGSVLRFSHIVTPAPLDQNSLRVLDFSDLRGSESDRQAWQCRSSHILGSSRWNARSYLIHWAPEARSCGPVAKSSLRRYTEQEA